MDYKKIYSKLIERSKNRTLKGYYETHHIIPRCIGGSNEACNLSKLTPEEHFLAHQLLIKIYPNEPKLIYAANMMVKNNPYQYRSNKLYGWLKRKLAQEMSNKRKGKSFEQLFGKRKSKEIRQKMSRPKSEEHKEKLRKPKSQKWKDNISLSHKGKKLSEKHKKNIGLGCKGKPAWNKGLPGLKGDKNGMFGKIGELNVRSKKIQCVDTGEIFISATEAKKKYGGCVDEAARKGHRAGGYYWKYI